MSRKLNTEEFKKNCINKFGNLYDYSLVDYNNNKTKIKIICNIHGIFEQTPNNHLSKCHKCPKCSIKYKDTDKFISDSLKIHGSKYDYSLADYKNSESVIKIICKNHGVFEQIARAHTTGSGCSLCSNNKSRLDFGYLISRFNIAHNNKYDYSLVNFINTRTKVKIICKSHGVFEQRPSGHLFGRGCPICRDSKGEINIREYLKNKKINFITQFKFNECFNKKKLPFDFYLPDMNLCIEYNGEQHYRPIDYFGGDKTFLIILKRDKIKRDFCKKNNIVLLEIRYDEKIENKLKECLNI
jgi:hypothetical protein